MKRITSNKKGFTLLEVMLAVAIMAVSSSMIMVGFLTTMTYSRNSALYSRVGESNYSGCITVLSNIKSNPSLKDSLNPASAGTHTVSVYGTNQAPTAASLNWGGRGTTSELYIRLEGDTESQIATTDGFNVARGSGTVFHTYLAEGDQFGGASHPNYADHATYSDNRSVIFYYCPLTCPICQTNGNVGTIEYGDNGQGEGFYCTVDHTGLCGGTSYTPDTTDGSIKIGHLDGSGAVVAD